jgi:hypothetical protein
MLIYWFVVATLFGIVGQTCIVEDLKLSWTSIWRCHITGISLQCFILDILFLWSSFLTMDSSVWFHPGAHWLVHLYGKWLQDTCGSQCDMHLDGTVGPQLFQLYAITVESSYIWFLKYRVTFGLLIDLQWWRFLVQGCRVGVSSKTLANGGYFCEALSHQLLFWLLIQNLEAYYYLTWSSTAAYSFNFQLAFDGLIPLVQLGVFSCVLGRVPILFGWNSIHLLFCLTA